MKKLLITAIVLMAACGVSMAGGIDYNTKTIVLNCGAIAASGGYTTTAQTWDNSEGYMSVVLMPTAGSGTYSMTYQCSSDKTTWVEPDNDGEIFSGKTLADGDQCTQYAASWCRYWRAVIRETGGASSITLTGRIDYR